MSIYLFKHQISFTNICTVCVINQSVKKKSEADKLSQNQF